MIFFEIAYYIVLCELGISRILRFWLVFDVEWGSSAEISRPIRNFLMGIPNRAKKGVRIVKGDVSVVETIPNQSMPSQRRESDFDDSHRVSSPSLHSAASITGSRSYPRTLIDYDHSSVSRDSYGERDEISDKKMRHKSRD